MAKQRFDPTERIGVSFIENIFLRDFQWIPRQIVQTDVGIDMLIEICNEGSPTGKLIGAQIKSGVSFFREDDGDSFIFRATKTHVDYWLNYSLPVVIIIYNPESNLTLWQAVNKDNVESTGKSLKIKIPKQQTLSPAFHHELENLSNSPKIISQIQSLLLDKELINLVNSVNKICIDLEMWVNKSSGRTEVQILKIVEDEDTGDNDEILISEFTLLGLRKISSLSGLFPWADFKIDDSFYEEYEDYDEDHSPGYKLIFTDDRFESYKIPMVPYSENGETESYRLVMSVNEYGKSFMDFFSFLEGGKQLALKL